MSFGFGFALPAYPLRGGGGNNPFNQLGPTLDLSFTGVVTDLTDPNGYTLNTDFIIPQYQIAAQYVVWETGVGLVDKTFSQIITFTRASTATYFDSAGVLQSAAIDAPRLDYNPSTLAAQGLLIEEARTNSIRNNTMQGVVAGTPGTAPTNWTVTSTGGVITRTIVGTGTENGITYIDIRYQASAIGNVFVSFDSTNFVAATPGQIWSGSAYVKLVGGTYTGITQTDVAITPRDAALVALADNLTIFTATTAALSTQRIITTHTMPATTAWVSTSTRIIGSGAFDITLRIGLPQLELGAFATSVIPTTTTALTRSADVAAVDTLSPWYNQTSGTMFVEAVTFDSLSSAFPRPFSVSDGTNSNVIQISRNNSSGNARMSVISGGAAQAAADATAWTLNATTKAALAYATNNFAIVANGGAVASDTSGAVPTVSKLNLGVDGGGSASQLNGWLRRLTYYPRALSAAELQAITA